MRLLIKNARISDAGDLVDIAISDGKIDQVGSGLHDRADQTIDAEGLATLPGFVEPHVHMDKALLYRRQPAYEGTLEEALSLTGKLKAEKNREDMLERSRAVLDMAVRAGTIAIRVHPDVDLIQGLLGVETALELKSEYQDLIDIQVVAFPQEGIIKAPGTLDLMAEAMKMGASVVGGCTYNEPDGEATKEHIGQVFDLAERFDAPVDMHADFGNDRTDPRATAAGYIAEQTISRGYQARVSLGHVTSLAALTTPDLQRVIGQLKEADIHIVTLPATDIYLGAGLTAIHQLQDAGVGVAISSNNVRNAFCPFGKADPLLIGNLLAHVAQFGTPQGQADILSMVTNAAARSVGLGDTYGLAEGRNADLVIFDCSRIDDVLLDVPVRRWVIKRGRVTVETQHQSRINRSTTAS